MIEGEQVDEGFQDKMARAGRRAWRSRVSSVLE